MNKLLLFAPAALLSALLFTACTKEENRVFNTRFYTSDPNQAIFLYVDDVYKGQLSFFQTRPDCGIAPGDGPKPLRMELNSGEYKVTGKDASGKVLSNSVIRLSASGMSSTGLIGGQTLDDNGSCLTIGLTK